MVYHADSRAVDRHRALAQNTLPITRDEHGVIVGALTLMILLTPGATFGLVEDVVVGSGSLLLVLRIIRVAARIMTVC